MIMKMHEKWLGVTITTHFKKNQESSYRVSNTLSQQPSHGIVVIELTPNKWEKGWVYANGFFKSLVVVVLYYCAYCFVSSHGSFFICSIYKSVNKLEQVAINMWFDLKQ